jgi:signal transduction histidine kinase
MNTKQSDFLNNTDSDSKTVFRVNSSSNSSDTSEEVVCKVIDTNDQLLFSLQKMEERNIRLEELVEEERKKLSEAIAVNAKFLNIVAHDLRDPFSTTIIILDLLKENFDGRNNIEYEQLINEASDSAINGLKLLENLLAWSRTQNAEKNFNPVKINLHDLVINEMKHFNTSAALKQIRIDQSIASDMYVTADSDMVKTIFRNLISNAIKYTNTGGNIHITANESKKFVKIEVADNGIGMTQQKKEKLFKVDEFYSAPGTNNERGTGLGLLFCKEFIDLHGGKILVESEPGKGSTFTFTLPHYI